MVTSCLLLQFVSLHIPDKPDATRRDGSNSDQKERNVCRTRNQLYKKTYNQQQAILSFYKNILNIV